jgi:hypothetical protein
MSRFFQEPPGGNLVRQEVPCSPKRLVTYGHPAHGIVTA